jgi:propanol-preferring alcohol dehydrogenase
VIAVRAMVMDEAGRALDAREMHDPWPGPGEVRLRVRACAICRTDLHLLDGDLPDPKLPLVLGHQIVGEVETLGDGVEDLRPGDRVGVPWLGWACGECRYCTSGRENLCPFARFTGYQRDGGYAELAVADARFCLPIPEGYGELDAAPLLCAGLIGYRALRMTGDAQTVGLYGFGNAARLVTQVARHEGRTVLAFTRPGDDQTQREALELGCEWAGDSTSAPPMPLDAAIVFAAVGDLVPIALGAVAPGGSVVCAEIHMSDIPSFPYELLWRERVLRSVANLTRRDGLEFLPLAAKAGVRATITTFPLERANEALEAARSGEGGTGVLVP